MATVDQSVLKERFMLRYVFNGGLVMTTVIATMLKQSKELESFGFIPIRIWDVLSLHMQESVKTFFVTLVSLRCGTAGGLARTFSRWNQPRILWSSIFCRVVDAAF